MKKEKNNKRVGLVYQSGQSTIAEQFRSIRTNMQFLLSSKNETNVVMVTSSEPGEGKTTVSSNLAATIAETGKRVLLIDADMRRGTQGKVFGILNSTGLSVTLNSEKELYESIHPTVIPNLFLLPAGPVPPNPAELLQSYRMDDILAEARLDYDYIIVDAPPIIPVTDAQILSSKVDGVIIVARENVSSKKLLFKTKDLLQVAQANVIGVIFNGVKLAKDSAYAYY